MQLIDPKPKQWSRAEYYQMAQLGWFEDKRTELIGGEVVLLNPQNFPHSYCVDKIAEMLSSVLDAGYWVRAQLPLHCVSSSEPEPDISVVEGSRDDYTDHPTTALLIVEISDTTLAFDRGQKASLYAQAGIADYWIVNLVDRVFEVHREPAPDDAQPFGHGYTSVRVLKPGQKEAPLAAPQTEIAVADLLP